MKISMKIQIPTSHYPLRWGIQHTRSGNQTDQDIDPLKEVGHSKDHTKTVYDCLHKPQKLHMGENINILKIPLLDYTFYSF